MFIREGCVYIITNQNHSVLYTGSTSDLAERIWQHRNKSYPSSFSARYNCFKLVYFKFYATIEEAIDEEYRVKAGNRKSKLAMINQYNPQWNDLYDSIG